MITLVRRAKDPAGAEIQTALEELVVAHTVEIVPAAPDAAAGVTTLPAIVDGERTICGDEALHAYLDELAAWMRDWRKYQSDTCYIDEDGETC